MGFINSKMHRPKMNIIMHGLDAAGKTTILYKLHLGEVVTTVPTIGFNVETIAYKTTTLTAIDVGGRSPMRPLFRHYYKNTDAIVFVVDSNDLDRMSEVKDEFERLMAEEVLKEAVLLVMANKQDLPGAMNVNVLAEKLDFGQQARSRRIHFQACTATTGDGLYEGFDWLTRELSRRTESHSANISHSEKLGKSSWSSYVKSSFVTLQTLLPKLN